MLLHFLRVFCICQYFEQFFVGKEEETREGAPFSFQIFVETLLDFIESFVALIEFDLEFFAVNRVVQIWSFIKLFHSLSPEGVNSVKLLLL